MGLVQYLAKFVPDVASVDNFSRAEVSYHSGQDMSYFRVDCRARIVVDASPVGLGAVLAQEQGGTWRAVLYASRSLTDMERRYSQHVSVRKKL